MHPLPLLAAASSLCVLAAAQNYTAHPIDNVNSSTSQNIPFAGNSTTWDEARSQFLFPAAFVPPTGGVVTGMELAIASTGGTSPYERFELWLDHTTNASLSLTFAANLTNPQRVFNRTPGTITWTPNGWNLITFDTPFVYDGVRNLVLDVRKKLDRPNNPTMPAVSTRVLVYPRRVDLPPPIWANGAHNSGAVDAVTATTTYSTQILIRLRWGVARTLTIDSSRDVTGNANRAYFHLGATLTTTTQGAAGERFFDLLDVGLRAVPIPIPGIAGEFWLNGVFPYFNGTLDANGRGSASLTIPQDPSLVGARVFFQSLTVGSSINLTNIVDAPLAVY